MSDSYITLEGKKANEGKPSYVWLAEHPSILCDQVSHGLQNMDGVRKFVDNISKTLQGKNVEHLSKGVTLPEFKNDQCPEFANGAAFVTTNTSDLIKAEIKFADQLKAHFSQDLATFYNANIKKKETLQKNHKKMEKDLKKAENTLKSNQKDCEAALDVLKKYLNSFVGTDASQLKTRDKKITTCQTKFTKYETQYAKTRDQKILFYTVQLPQTLSELEKIERLRLHTMKNLMNKYVQVIENYLNKVTRFHQEAVTSYEKLDGNSEFDNYVRDLMKDKAPNKPIEDIPFGLTCKASDITADAKFTTIDPKDVRKELSNEYKDVTAKMYSIPEITYCDDNNDSKRASDTQKAKKNKFYNRKKSNVQNRDSTILEAEYEIKHSVKQKELTLTTTSSAAEVKRYLQANNFDPEECKGKNGKEMFELTKEECKDKYGIANGIRLSNRLTAYKDEEDRS